MADTLAGFHDAESILRKAAASFFDTLSQMCEGILLVDAAMRVVWINDRYERYLKALGFDSPADIIGKRVEDAVPNTLMHEIVRTGQPILLDILENKAGTYVVSRFPLRDESGQVIGAVGLILYDQIEPLRPLIAVPTTTGTGSESTTVCVLDVIGLSVKTGISHEALRPTLAVVDPELTLTQPTGVTAASGMDILCHALESYTARPYTGFERHRAAERVPYCGANPIADMWCEKALALLAGSFRRSVRDGSDRQARGEMALAATFAGMGFGNAGVHIPHANGYPIAGQAKDFRAADYPQGEALVPHGVAVALTAPEAFRFTFAAAPERHLRAGRLLNPDAVMTSDPADFLPGIVAALMADIGLPNGLAAVGFGAGDIADLVAGTMRQQRLLAVAPVPVTEDDIARIFERSMRLWCAN